MAFQLGSSFEYNVDVVGSCNLRCPSCPVGNLGPDAMPTGLMSLEMFRRVLEKIDQERPAETIIVSLYDWGEPTLHPNLDKMILMIKKAGFIARISSNLNVDNKLREVIKAEPHRFVISTSGMFDDTYKRTHTGGSAIMLKSNIYRIAWLRDRYKSSTEFVIYYHLYKHNQGRDLEEARRIADEVGFRLETFAAFLYPMEKNLTAIDGGTSPIDQKLVDLLILSPTQRIQLLQKFAKSNIDHPMVTDCARRTTKMSIRFDGSVPLCCTVYDASIDAAGSFLNTPHAQIQSARYDRTICSDCMENGLHLVVRMKQDDPGDPAPSKTPALQRN